MRTTYCILGCLVFCLLITGTADARTYAGNLQIGQSQVPITGSQQIVYHLNDDAATVTIEIKDGSMATVRTLDASEPDPAQRPGLSQGQNVVEWDLKDDDGDLVEVGNYTFTITTTDFGYTEWTNITPYEPTTTPGYIGNATETVISARFWSPNGLGVLKDKNDPNFGRIFVANGSGGTAGPYTSSATGAYHNQSGVYFLNCDLSDTGEGWLDTTPGTLFNTLSQYNPFKLNVDSNRRVFVCGGYSDGWEDLYIVEIDGSSYVTAFSRADFVSGGNFDNLLHTAFTGTGAETKLWSNFEKDNSYPSLATWATGWPITGPITVPFTLELDDSAAINGPENGINFTIYAMRTICVSADENYLFFSNRRWAASTIACAKMDITGATAPQFVSDTMSWRAAFAGTDREYGNFNSVDIMIDPVDLTEKLVLQRYYAPSHVYIVDAGDMSLLDDFTPDPGANTTGECVWDPVGNVIYSDISREWLRVYAPPSDPFTFEMDYPGSFQVVTISGLSTEDWEVYR